MQLTLELRRARGHHVLDTLFVEAWKCVKFEKLVNLENSELYDFVFSFKCGLFSLAELKISTLQRFQEAVTFPLSYGVFGHLADEDIEVVQIADHERRMQDHRFINLKHILSGLSLSRVGETVQRILSDRLLNCLSLKPVKVPIYIIYKLSGDVACVCARNQRGGVITGMDMMCGYSDDCAGRDAALIVSRRGNVKQGVTLDSYVEKVQEEDGSTEMAVNECKEQHLGKKKVRGTSKARGRDSCGKKVKLHHLPDF